MSYISMITCLTIFAQFWHHGLSGIRKTCSTCANQCCYVFINYSEFITYKYVNTTFHLYSSININAQSQTLISVSISVQIRCIIKAIPSIPVPPEMSSPFPTAIHLSRVILLAFKTQDRSAFT